jgi:hypothetical protein
MQDYPILPNSIPTFVNEALAAFIHAHITKNVKKLTSSVPRGDGLGLLKRLQTMNASATSADRTRALQQLYEPQTQNKEAIINFVSRFRNQIQVLSNTTINPQDMPTDKELRRLFLSTSFARMYPSPATYATSFLTASENSTAPPVAKPSLTLKTKSA